MKSKVVTPCLPSICMDAVFRVLEAAQQVKACINASVMVHAGQQTDNVNKCSPLQSCYGCSSS